VNILLTHNSIWWNAASYYAVTLGKALERHNHTTIFCTTTSSPEAKRAKTVGLNTCFINFNCKNPFGFFREKKRLRNIIEENDIDIINCLSPQSHFFSIFPSRVGEGEIPVVRTCCDAMLPKRNVVNRWIYKKHADFVLFTCKSNYLNYQNTLKVDFENYDIIYAGIDKGLMGNSNREENLKKQYELPEDSLIVGHLGRWSPEKGIDLFLEICGGITKLHNNVYFMMAGKEEQISKSYILDKAKSCGIYEKLILIDWLEDVRRFLGTVDLGLITSQSSEVISRAALEYMAAGKPLVVSDMNVLPEIVDNGINGYVCGKGNKENFVEKCNDILSNEELRLKMGKESQSLIERKFNLDVFASAHLKIYNKVLDEYKQCRQ